MSVNFFDLKATYLELQTEIDASIKRVLESGWYILGEEVDAFEQEYAAYCEAKHCVGVVNGLDALQLALLALGVGAGDEVIVPSNTYIATWLAVSQCGATPITRGPVADPVPGGLGRRSARAEFGIMNPASWKTENRVSSILAIYLPKQKRLSLSSATSSSPRRCCVH